MSGAAAEHGWSWERVLAQRLAAEPTARTVHRCVVLRHRRASGGWHLDWLIESRRRGAAEPWDVTPGADADERSLAAVRVAGGFPPTIGGEAIGEVLDAHRARYLWFEGELSGGRGLVERVASGVLVAELTVGEELEHGCGRCPGALSGELWLAAGWRGRVWWSSVGEGGGRAWLVIGTGSLV